jgi:hypothetical protein
MIGQSTAKEELTLWSLSNIREGRCGFAGASPSLKLEKSKERERDATK